jgi:hypothetical protein
MCESPQKAARRPFGASTSEVFNKVIHRRRADLQLFSGIQNLAANLKFYFNFGAAASFDGVLESRLHFVAAGFVHHAA